MVDAESQRYVNDSTTGGFTQMQSVAQRVLLLIAFGVPRQAFVTPQAFEAQRQNIRTALAPLIDVAEPAIELQSIDVGSDDTAHMYSRIKYRNLLTGQDESVQAT